MNRTATGVIGEVAGAVTLPKDSAELHRPGASLVPAHLGV